MTATKTAARTTTNAEAFLPEQAAAALHAAQARRTEVLDRIAAGGNVEPVELAEADDHLRLAELRIELGERNAAAAAERARLSRLAELVDSLTDAAQRRRLNQVVAAYQTALTANQALFDAAKSRQDIMRADLTEVRRLAFGSDRTSAQQLPLPPGCSIEADGFTVSVTANGVTASLGNFDDAAALVAEVAASASAADTGTIAQGLRSIAPQPQYSRVGLLERMLAASHDGGE